MPSTEFLIQWLITWVVLAVVFYVAADQIQRYLYETPVDRLAWRVMGVTPLLAAVLVNWPLPFQDLFFKMSSASVQAVLWFLACWLGLRFQWRHAAAAGVIAVMTIAPVASSSVDKFANRSASATADGKAAAKASAPAAVSTATPSPPGIPGHAVPAPGTNSSPR